MKKFKFIKCIFFSFLFLICNSLFAQIATNYSEAQRGIQRDVNRIPRYSTDDFSSIKEKIAIDRKVSDEDLTNQTFPDEIQKKELLKYARAFRDRSNEIANVQKKYANEPKYRLIKDIILKESELTIENGNNVHNLFADGVRKGSTFGEMNSNDRLNETAIEEKRKAINSLRDIFIANFIAVENSYWEFNFCIAQISKRDDKNYLGFPDTIFIKIKNDESCKKYKSTDISTKTINDFLGQGKTLSIRSNESENYRYDIEFSCSLASIWGGFVVRRGDQIQIPDCVQGMGQFIKNYESLIDYNKKKNEEEFARQEDLKKAEKENAEKQSKLAEISAIEKALNCGDVCTVTKEVIFNKHIGQCYVERTPRFTCGTQKRPARCINDSVSEYCDNNYDTENLYVSAYLKNNSLKIIKDVRIYCRNIATSGTVIGNSSVVIYEVFHPNKIYVVNFKVPQIAQTNNVECSTIRN